MALSNNYEEMTSELVVLDTKNFPNAWRWSNIQWICERACVYDGHPGAQ
jgi:hypothetical protein